jgi:biopolymer transport protein ExbD
MRFRKALARKKRRDREAEGEIKELNITAMMDLMTIILVFLIKSFSASSITVTASEDVRPPSSTARATPKDTIAITVTPKSIMVGDKKKVSLNNAAVAPG